MGVAAIPVDNRNPVRKNDSIAFYKTDGRKFSAINMVHFAFLPQSIASAGVKVPGACHSHR